MVSYLSDPDYVLSDNTNIFHLGWIISAKESCWLASEVQRFSNHEGSRTLANSDCSGIQQTPDIKQHSRQDKSHGVSHAIKKCKFSTEWVIDEL